MPKFIKHVGQLADSGNKCVVMFRTIPGEPNSCLVIETEKLATQYHDNLMEAVESTMGQEDVDFYKYAQRATFFDGRNMLEACHLSGWLTKVSTSQVIMMPTKEIQIPLSELNIQLDSQNNEAKTTSGDINQPEELNSGRSPGILDDRAIAQQMRAQAASFKMEAERLLKEAEALDPAKPAGKTAKATTVVDTATTKGRGRPKKAAVTA